MNARRIVLGAALAATLAAVFWPQPEEEGTAFTVAEPRQRSAPVVASALPTPAAGADRALAPAAEEPAAPRLSPEMAGDLFPSQTWVPPPPPPPKPAPPPPPEPPPLPFKYLGRWNEAGGEVLFVSHGNRVLGIRGGDELPGGWQVAEIGQRGVVFNYKPLNIQRTLGIAP